MADKEGNWFKRHKILTVIITLVAVIAVAGAAGGGSDTTNSSNSNEKSSEGQKAATTAKIGEPARDGKFEFIVKKAECGKKQVGNEFLNKKAQGQFCLVSISVKNIGEESQALSSFDQFAFDAEGKKYTADDEATSYANPMESGSTFYNEINPGNKVDGILVFDVPKGVKLTEIELHDSSFSGGVKVKL